MSIPKIIHYCWLSGEPYPEKIAKCLSTWDSHLDDYQIILWDKNKFDINSVKWTKEAYESQKYAFAADYIRFYALYNYGGIYLDSDVEVVKSFDDLLDCDSFLGYEFTGVPEAAIVGAIPKSKWIKGCLDWYDDRSFCDEKGNMKTMVLPMILKSIYEGISSFKMIASGEVQKWDNNYIYPYDFFSPKNTFNKTIERTENTYTVHHFQGGWLTKSPILKLKKNTHKGLQKILGKAKYLKLLYFIRTYIKKIN
jgi:hypothetical protein